MKCHSAWAKTVDGWTLHEVVCIKGLSRAIGDRCQQAPVGRTGVNGFCAEHRPNYWIPSMAVFEPAQLSLELTNEPL